MRVRFLRFRDFSAIRHSCTPSQSTTYREWVEAGIFRLQAFFDDSAFMYTFSNDNEKKDNERGQAAIFRLQAFFDD